MNPKTLVSLKPFAVPTEATLQMPPRPKQEGMQPLPTIPLESLEPDALEALAQTWLDQLFASVNRRSPFYLTAKAAPNDQ